MSDVDVEITRYDYLPKPLKATFLILTVFGLSIAVFYLFSLSIKGFILYDVGYYYLFVAAYATCVFLILPGRKKDKRIPWYDVLAAVLTFGICVYFYFNSYEILVAEWNNIPLGFILILLILEGGRRVGGSIYFAVTVLLALYPLVAGHMPGFLWGRSLSFSELVVVNAFKSAGLLSINTKALAELLIGFLVFAGVLIHTGAGDFFIKLALVLCGRFRGGAAKVSVVSSALFGSLSGSVLSNVTATGTFTIPTMKRLGYPPEYAGAIEACASTGGALMPPVMGAVAFIMAEFINMEYAVVMTAAIIPAVLYYLGLLLQVDAYAAKVGLRGLAREDLPSLKKTLLEGWPFIFILLFLVWGLLYMRWESMAPWYATGLALLLSFYRRQTMMTPKRIANVLVGVGQLLAQSTAIILPMGFIMAGITITGLSGSFSAEMISLSQENVYIMLLIGAAACYLMGMVGMVIPAYVFLAVTLAPAAIKIGGLNVIATHLFIIYYSLLAPITPPVAAAAFLAGTMAGANLMKTAYVAMRLGVVIYFVPFFFVFNPSLVLQGPILEILYHFVLAVLGVIVIAAGFEGYLFFYGRLRMWQRLFLIIAGLLLALPELITSAIGAILAVVVIAIGWARIRATKLSASASIQPHE